MSNNILNSTNINSVITNNITSSMFFSDFDRNFISVLEEVAHLDNFNMRPSPTPQMLPPPPPSPPTQSDMITQLLLSPQETIEHADMSQLYSLLFPNINNTTQNESLYDENPIKKLISEKGKEELIRMKYSKNCQNHTCPILCRDFVEGDDIIKLPCNHCFEPNAIETWVNKEKAECPVCRFQLDYIEKKTD